MKYYSMNDEIYMMALSVIPSEPLDELSFLGALFVLIAIFYKFISAFQLVSSSLKSIIGEQSLPAVIAIVSVAATVGISGSGYIFVSNNQLQPLQDSLLLPIIHIFLIENIAIFLISKRTKVKKYVVFIMFTLGSALVFENNYEQVYTIISLLIFGVAVILYHRTNSVKERKSYSILYLKIGLATSYVLSILIISNVLLNFNAFRLANILLVIITVTFTQYEFHLRIMSEVDYL